MFFYDVLKKESTYEGKKVSISKLNKRGKKYDKFSSDKVLLVVMI